MLDNKVIKTIEQYTKDWHNWSNNKRKMHGYPMRRKPCNSKKFCLSFSKRKIYESVKASGTNNFIIDKLLKNHKSIILPELGKGKIAVIPTGLKPIKIIFGDKDANL
jgi:hypothetical protein